MERLQRRRRRRHGVASSRYRVAIATKAPKNGLPPEVDNKKLRYRRETARQLRTSFSARSLIVHFTEHRTVGQNLS